MHKILLTTLLALGLFSRAFSQSFPYEFSYSNEPYEPLTNGIELDSTQLWDYVGTVPLGFEFKFGGVYHKQLFLDAYSFILAPQNYLDSDTIDAVIGYTTLAGFEPKANTIARYITEGVAPNRIAKVEIYRAGFYDIPGEVSAQIWLYETSNVIQIRLGDQVISSPNDVYFNGHSPLIGYMLKYHPITTNVSIFPQAQFVVGTPDNPQDSIVINGLYNENSFDGPQYGPSGIPLNNSVYTFKPGTVATHQPLTQSLRIMPNPAYDRISLKGIETQGTLQVELLDMQGRQVGMYTLENGERTLQLPEQAAPGTYMIRCTADGKTVMGKVSKM